jgi:hypothetical protein
VTEKEKEHDVVSEGWIYGGLATLMATWRGQASASFPMGALNLQQFPVATIGQSARIGFQDHYTYPTGAFYSYNEKSGTTLSISGPTIIQGITRRTLPQSKIQMLKFLKDITPRPASALVPSSPMANPGKQQHL